MLSPSRCLVWAYAVLPSLLLAAVSPACAGIQADALASDKPLEKELLESDEPTAESLSALIANLGNSDYHKREAAAAAIQAIGPTALDALLTAAEMSDDLEVSMRSRSLVNAIPLHMPHDSAEVAKLLDAFKRGNFAERVRVMHRLLRVDNNAGIEPLARLVRLDRSTIGSRVASALLAREWSPNDPFWDPIRAPILAGLARSTRPTAVFLRSLVAFAEANASLAEGRQQTPSQRAVALAQQAESLAESTAAFEILSRGAADEPHAGEQDVASGTDTSVVTGETIRIFARCRMDMLLAAGRRDEAVAMAAQALEACCSTDRQSDTAVAETVAMLVWGVDHGMPEIVDRLALHPEFIGSHSLVGYAAAFAEQTRHDKTKAEKLADEAFAQTEAAFDDRLKAAILLAKWGCNEWATRAYGALVDNPETPAADFALTTIMYSEFLHDQSRDDEATKCLQKLIDGRGDEKGNEGPQERVLQLLGRDPRSIRSRMHFFDACDAEARQDTVACRSAVGRSLDAYAKDVDALIALYKLPDNTAKQRSDAVLRIKKALVQIDSEIEAVPDDTNGYNEYAWLVANTEGDIEKATRYSKLSLIMAFDNSSYLDTLAHCRLAAGDHAGAIRWQSLAQRQEPHNRTIQRNLERFRQLAK